MRHDGAEMTGLRFEDEKFGEMADAPVTVPATSTKFASNCTMPARALMPAKKALDGSWTLSRIGTRCRWQRSSSALWLAVVLHGDRP
jgi:hypothetical protein